MKEFFSADGRAKFWPQTATLPTMLQFARASTTHGQHLRIVHALLDDIDVGSQILDTFVEFPTKHLDLGGSVTPQLIESVLAKHKHRTRPIDGDGSIDVCGACLTRVSLVLTLLNS